MQNNDSTVFIVDDDEAILKGLKLLISSVGLHTQVFTSPLDFLDTYDIEQPGCLLLDIRMPQMSGLQVQKQLRERNIDLPVIFITGHGDTATAVEAMKDGAFDFIEKPFKDYQIIEAIQRAIQQDIVQRETLKGIEDIQKRHRCLTDKEKEVMKMIVSGLSSKEIAGRLSISSKTVDVHRTRILEKMGASSSIYLTRMAIKADLCEA